MKTYPMVNLLLRHGNRMADAAALVMPIGAFLLVAYGWAWPTVVAGILLGAAVYIVAHSYVELVQIIADTLLPR